MVVTLWPVLTFVYVATDNETDHAVASDVIIVLGCPSYEGNVVSTTFSSCLLARAHHAAELYHKGLAGHIIPTGGLTGPAPSEAAAMGQVLEGDGVPRGAIILEEQARSTVQNVQFSRDIMQANGWRTAILVSDPHHIKRAAVIARDGGLNVTTSPATTNPGWHNLDERRKNLLRDARALMTYHWEQLRGGPP